MATLELKQIRKTYDDTEVIHGVDLLIESGEFCVFVGPSGCGKSTLLRMIAGLEDITAGDVEIEGEVVSRVPAAQRGLAMVFQSYALYPHMTVFENMAFGLRLRKTPTAEIKSRVQAAGDMLEIGDLLERKPGALSGGQRQRVAMGRAIVREPSVFLFDEPLSNLDARLRVQMRLEIASLHKKLGSTMVYVTHDQVEAMTLADRIAIMSMGRLQQCGSPVDVYRRPKNKFVAGFIGSPGMNFVDGKLTEEGGAASFVGQGFRVGLPAEFLKMRGTATCLGVRPEHMSLVEAGGTSAVVEHVEHMGSHAFAYVMLGTFRIVVKVGPDQIPIPGEKVQLGFDEGAFHLFDADGDTMELERL